MSYKDALEKAWVKLKEFKADNISDIKFLADNYSIDLSSHQVVSLSCNIPPHEHVSILILHYLAKKIQGLPEVTGKWISFQELPGGQGYYDAFKKRSLELIGRKYGKMPQGIVSCLERLPGKAIQYGDGGIVLEAFDFVPVLVTVWGQDDEFSAEANILFDQSVKEIFCTEDIVVLSDIISRVV
ncbi:MAG: hypothetical protein COS99_08350 [Candidatus Omnitrophica bacterium CG07_land_8_20_14_0_80_42_15]|uniref:DUF3786 domain-containing protein n=1 Tax=Candidatus Aquitaenariimonas noxiae TaxID=1974741 RepID=A0A2J0KR73_9BACT|nr:MAG: hypothetical protein COS99_08350 [Candidatus Omnitrophica bacterium CG07_land_8_20_14_0_80_42_15]